MLSPEPSNLIHIKSLSPGEIVTIQKLLITLISLVLLASCAVAPFSSPKSAKSIGKSKNQIDFGLSPTPYVMYGHGITKNWDLGFQGETQFFASLALGPWTRYSLINNRKGFSLALYGGASYGFGLLTTYSVFGGPIISYRKGKFEPYLLVRYNITSFSDFDADDTLFDSGDSSINYLESVAGFNIWMKKDMGINLNVKHFYAFEDSGDDSIVLAGVSLLFKF